MEVCMRKVLVSLKPYYYYLVCEGIKTIEVRKGMPKSEGWDRDTFFYMSKDEKSFAKIPKEFQEKYRKHFGKVGLRFICDRIDDLRYVPTKYYLQPAGTWEEIICKSSCLSVDQIKEYAKGKAVYGWHISDLKIYGKPKELSEFRYHCKYEFDDDFKHCSGCDYHYCSNTPSSGREEYCGCDGLKSLTRPPQSWQYVEVEK